MKRLTKNILVAVLGAVTLTAFAQDAAEGTRRAGPEHGPGQGPGGPRRGPSPLVVALDANHDGILDATEIANAAVALRTLDKNNDGQLSKDELHPGRPAGAPDAPPANAPEAGKGPGPGAGGPRRGAPPIMAALDANHDGVLDATELANAPAALLTLDKNGDGILSHDEIAPPRPEGGRGPGGPGPKGHGPGPKAERPTPGA